MSEAIVAPARSNYSGADWLRRQLLYVKPAAKLPSEFGSLVADILGAAFFGIYHLLHSQRDITRVDWSNESAIVVPLWPGRELATYDGSELSVLAVLCHDACVRFAVDAHGMSRLRMLFHRRYSNGDGTHNRHWTIECAVERVREAFFDARSRATTLPAKSER